MLAPRSRGRDGLRGQRFDPLTATGTRLKTKQAAAGRISTANRPRMPGFASVCAKTCFLFWISPKGSLMCVVLERGRREDGMEGCGLGRHWAREQPTP